MKIAINTSFEEFELSIWAIDYYLKCKNLPRFLYHYKHTSQTPIEYVETKSIKIANIIVTEYLGPNPTEEEVEKFRFKSNKILRNDIDLINMIEKFGSKKISGDYSSIHIVEIPDDIDWIVCNYDCYEWVAENHRIWEFREESKKNISDREDVLKIAINTSFEDFELSNCAIYLYLKQKNLPCYLYRYKTTMQGRNVYEETKSLKSANRIVTEYLGPNPTEEELEKNWFNSDIILRDDTVLIEIIEKYGSKIVSVGFSDIHVIEIPNNVDWIIGNYDGYEWIAEKHRIWEWGEDGINFYQKRILE